jgi:hypothetical protein
MLKDNTKFGILLGIIGPLLAMLIFYVWKFNVLTLSDFISFMLKERKLLVSCITFSLLANALSFTIFINSRKDYTAKGIFIITMVWAILIIALKFF